MQLYINPQEITGLTQTEKDQLSRLVTIYERHCAKNEEKNRYYEGKISLGEVNLGIALPKRLHGLEIGCAWGAKTVDVLAARSMFDGFVGITGEPVEELTRIADANNLIPSYNRATRDELKLGCTFAALSKDEKIGCKIRWYSSMAAAAEWDGDKGRIKAGFAVVATETDPTSGYGTAKVLYFYTDDAVIILTRTDRSWAADRRPHKMGRPLMEPMAWNATNGKPLGRSRLKDPIRRLIQGYVRTIANATIGLEFATSPQKYLLGVTEDQYDAIINDKFRQYVGAIIAGTTNPETGQNPVFGQLPQGNIQPHVEMVRILATQFSAATGLSVTDTGIVNDANPSSSDAILAQSQTLVAMAEQLNAGNGESLKTIALMALAIARDTTLEELTEDDRKIVAHFRNPAMPSVAVTTDAAIKIAGSREGFAQTDTYLEMIGFSQADIRRIKAQEQRNRGLRVLDDLEDE